MFYLLSNESESVIIDKYKELVIELTQVNTTQIDSTRYKINLTKVNTSGVNTQKNYESGQVERSLYEKYNQLFNNKLIKQLKPDLIKTFYSICEFYKFTIY